MTGQSTSLRFPQLKEKQQTGSKVRCHLLTHGTKGEVAQRLTALIEPFGECCEPAGLEKVENSNVKEEWKGWGD
jgi:hypothetical protein